VFLRPHGQLAPRFIVDLVEESQKYLRRTKNIEPGVIHPLCAVDELFWVSVCGVNFFEQVMVLAVGEQRRHVHQSLRNKNTIFFTVV
jgi:hypothetical protein